MAIFLLFTTHLMALGNLDIDNCSSRKVLFAKKYLPLAVYYLHVFSGIDYHAINVIHPGPVR